MDVISRIRQALKGFNVDDCDHGPEDKRERQRIADADESRVSGSCGECGYVQHALSFYA